jgi:hypothetical protein
VATQARQPTTASRLLQPIKGFSGLVKGAKQFFVKITASHAQAKKRLVARLLFWFILQNNRNVDGQR